MSFDQFESRSSHISTFDAVGPAPMRAVARVELFHALWEGLKRGCFRVRETTTLAHEVSATIVLADRVPTRAPTLARAGTMLECVLRGQLQKGVGYEHDVGPSTVALALRQSLERMGLSLCISRVPLAIPLLAHAARGQLALVADLRGALPMLPGEDCLIRFQRTEGSLAQQLSAGELEVAQMLVEGRSYEEMARLRGTSIRTIANQICAVGRKLGTRGRFDLLAATFRAQPASDEPADTVPPPSGVGLHRLALDLR